MKRHPEGTRRIAIIKRVPQVVGVAIYCLFAYMIITKAYKDISWIAVSYPDDFWQQLGLYFVRNAAG